MKVYLDNAATTKVAEKVLQAMLPYFSDKYGNASSLHEFGREAKLAIENAREKIMKRLHASEGKLIFTSGGTEANNLAIKGFALANASKGKHLITQKTEHSSVLKSFERLETLGFEVTYINVDREGFVKLDELEQAIRDDTILVSIMHANNEIGTIQPIEEISKICRKHGIAFHTDASQSFTKVPLEAKMADMITLSSHKIYGPKGIGALYIASEIKLKSLLSGGMHEFGLRAGTENVPAIVGFGEASTLIGKKEVEHMQKLRDTLIEGIEKNVSDVRLNGARKQRLCNNANFSFKGVEGEALLLRLDAKGIACSTGSACASGKLKASHVLLAIGLNPKLARSSLRFTTGIFNTEEQIKYAIEVIAEEVEKLRKAKS